MVMNLLVQSSYSEINQKNVNIHFFKFVFFSRNKHAVKEENEAS